MMQKKTHTYYWPRLKMRVRDDIPRVVKTAATRAPVTQETVRKFRDLVQGLLYVGLFCAVLFLEVYVRTQLKSHSLEIWMLERKKAEIESDMTRLDMRLTVLESPLRLESLASTEIGLTAANPQEKTPTVKP